MDRNIYGLDAAVFRPGRWLESGDLNSEAMDTALLSVNSPQFIQINSLAHIYGLMS